MTSRVALIEINVYESMVPLVSGYLQSYACRNPQIKDAYEFRKYSTSRKTPVAEMLDAIERSPADVYAFSCYVWNMGLVKALLSALVPTRPDATFVLGGPQVMHHAERYLDPGNERMLVCNGEGERTFAGILSGLLQGAPDFAHVRGLTFYRDGALITTEREERIRDLDEIPSPFLNDLFDPGYRMSVIETNRGCPFRCGFCYWGAANNDQVYRFSEQRIREEISWLARNEVPVLHIADANWGMLKRDIDLSHHIADCKSEHYHPVAVIFAAAKNSPARVTEATAVFTEAGLINTQPISMQSLDENSLKAVDRKNIQLSAYADLQEDLNRRGIGSYIELIWPLPGETLASFKAGVEKLRERGAASIIVYAHLLLHNTPIFNNRQAHGLATRTAYDPAAEAEIIVQTNDVDYQDFKRGMWFIYAINALHNTHSMDLLSTYLRRREIMGYAELLDRFIEFCRRDTNSPFTQFCELSIEEARYYDFTNYPAIYHMVLHGERPQFSASWRRFCSTQPWWTDDDARFLFELDTLGKPFLYRNTPPEEQTQQFELLQISEVLQRGCLLEIPDRYAPLVSEFVRGCESTTRLHDGARLRIEHPRIFYPYNPAKPEEDTADYCSGMITRVAGILPTWSWEVA